MAAEPVPRSQEAYHQEHQQGQAEFSKERTLPRKFGDVNLFAALCGEGVLKLLLMTVPFFWWVLTTHDQSKFLQPLGLTFWGQHFTGSGQVLSLRNQDRDFEQLF